MGGKGGSDVEDNSDKAARIQGEFAQDAARDATYADRINTYNPFGSSQYATNSYIDPSTGKEVTVWNQYNQLNPEYQQMLDQMTQRVHDQTGYSYDFLNQAPVDVNQFGYTNMGNYQPINMPWVDTGRGNINQFGDVDMSQYGQQDLGRTNTGVSNLGQFGNMDMSQYGQQGIDQYGRVNVGDRGQFDMSDYGMMGAVNPMDRFGQGNIGQFGPADMTQFQDLEYDPTNIRNQAQDAAMSYAQSRLDPRFEQEREALDVRLRNQGLRPGDQAYEAQMDQYGREKNDAYNTAAWTSWGEGRQEAGQLWDQQLQGGNFANQWEQQQFQNEFGQQQADISNYLSNRGQDMNAFLQGQGQQLQDIDQAYGRQSNYAQNQAANYLQQESQNAQNLYQAQQQQLQDVQESFGRDYGNRQADIQNYLQARDMDMQGYLQGRTLDTQNQLQNVMDAYGRQRGNIDSNVQNYLANRGQDMQGYLDSQALNAQNLFQDQAQQFEMEQAARQNALSQYLAGREQTRAEYGSVNPDATLANLFQAFGGG